MTGIDAAFPSGAPKERDWEQFHDPKSLILALTGEVGELAELFQRVKADEAVGCFRDAAADDESEPGLVDCDQVLA